MSKLFDVKSCSVSKTANDASFSCVNKLVMLIFSSIFPHKAVLCISIVANFCHYNYMI